MSKLKRLLLIIAYYPLVFPLALVLTALTVFIDIGFWVIYGSVKHEPLHYSVRIFCFLLLID